ncbi:MAG TPA: amidophosphoribosyltransferase [Candidatus Cloacimonetes bacterium]|nr:amidophosphoribosyltransferase [Candidatus Cloacimonadota bacterium]HEX37608.1 amidophosphoribosyltransferase [Candidatus Cloacimonadota bacterium]
MCGIIGIYQKNLKLKTASKLAVLGLFAEQHRGQESCGIVYYDGTQLQLIKKMGLVKEVFHEDKLRDMRSHVAIGHVRYPTKGSSDIQNAQPHVLNNLSGAQYALASNGDLVNYKELRSDLKKKNVLFESGNDGELILKYIVYKHEKDGLSIIDSIKSVMKSFKGSFSTVLLVKDEFYAFRDPHGNRPFIFGEIDDETYVFASESCCIDIMKASFVKEVAPAEILHISNDGLTSYKLNPNEYRTQDKTAHCVFELIYFSRPDSVVYEHSVYSFRESLGKQLAKEETIIPDIVVPVPDSSNFIALGYAREMNVEFSLALIRNHYVGRTFIAPEQTIRDENVVQKFNPLPGYLEGKVVTLIDDSIVRGTTLQKIVKIVRSHGAKEVHVRIGSPMVKYPCFYGIDTPTYEELIANQKKVEDIAKYLKADSLRYLEVEELKNLVKDKKNFCFACFDGNYPICLKE